MSAPKRSVFSESMRQSFVPPPAQFRLAICVPSNGLWVADFGLCLVALRTHLAVTPVADYSSTYVWIESGESSILPCLRQHLLETAIVKGATHALFLDSDMTFPSNSVHRLARHRKAIVGCNYACRGQLPIEHTAAVRSDDGTLVPPAGTGVQEVEVLATGVMLIDLTILQKMAKPWFLFVYDETTRTPIRQGQHWVSEDWYFCLKAREAGYKTYVDNDLSREIGHVGQFKYMLGYP